MQSYRIYYVWLSTILVTGIFLLLGTAVYLEPFSGDLSRLGGYPENAFGWRIPQERFSTPLYAKDGYDKYYDVVVFGDSFSFKSPGEQTDVGSYWTNYFANRTGLSLVSFHIGKTGLEEVVGTKIFLRSPPRFFIFEYVERDIAGIPQKLGAYGGYVNGCKPAPAPIMDPLVMSPLRLSPQPFDRKEVYLQSGDDLFGLNLTATANLLRKSIFRNILGIDNTGVINLKLTRGDLFSNNSSSEVLIYSKDTLKKNWTKKQMKEVQCSLISLQNAIQSNGKTYFILLIVPDKLTVYDGYLKDKQYVGFGKIGQLENLDLNMPKLRQRIKREVAAGIKDIYMPNDTHWGVNAHKMAADVIIDYLMEAGQLVLPLGENHTGVQ